MDALHTLTRHHLVVDSSMTNVTSQAFSPPRLRPDTSVLRRSTSVQTPRRISAPSALPHRRSFTDFERLSRRTSLARRPSQVFDTCRSESRRLKSWTENVVRKTLVRFRTRKSATRTLARRRDDQPRVPSRAIKTVVNERFDKFASGQSLFGERLIAVVYCWFYTWILGIYYSFTDDGHNRSFLKWVLATLMVTGGAILFISLSVIVLYYVNMLLFLLTSASLYFVGTLFAFLFCILGFLAIVNFD